ncbi:MAG: SDR family oxidoreductase [Polyangiaceae bacterium]
MTKSIILITGATAGIGRAAALHLARKGHHVIATGRRQGALDSLEAEAQSERLALDTLRLDVTDQGSIDDAVAKVDAFTDGHGVDVLVNNAGYGLAAPLAEVSSEDLRHQFDTNVFGLMATTQAFLPRMVKRGAGRIINVSSIGGRITFPMMGAYHASKYAVEALSDAMRMELSPCGIHVSVIEPGPIKTEFIDRLNDAANPYKVDSSLYAKVFDRTDAIEDQAMAFAPGPEVIARAIERAATARRPRARYIAPLWSRAALTLLGLIPVPLRDAMMRAMFGLSAKQIAPSRRLAAGHA